MKVGVVTYHRAASYGACLQAYATQQILIALGNDVEIIDYTNAYEQRAKKIFFTKDGKISGRIKNGIKNILFCRKKLLGKAFDSFTDNYYLSPHYYTNVEQMGKLEYDTLVVGSDQVWNPQISNGLDDVFLLNFGQAKRRISLSSSFGSYVLNDNEKKRFADCIKKFDAISVREDFAAHQIMELQNMGVNNVKVICDPTMMLSVKKWKALMKKPEYISKKRPYILTYFVSGSYRDFQDDVKRINKNKSYEIWNLQSSNFKWRGTNRKIVGATVEEFLALIDNASIVITDSFHGAVFSILFNKSFEILDNKLNPIRTDELLEKLGIENSSFTKTQKLSLIGEDEYRTINEKITQIREDAITWLKDNLN